MKLTPLLIGFEAILNYPPNKGYHGAFSDVSRKHNILILEAAKIQVTTCPPCADIVEKVGKSVRARKNGIKMTPMKRYCFAIRGVRESILRDLSHQRSFSTLSANRRSFAVIPATYGWRGTGNRPHESRHRGRRFRLKRISNSHKSVPSLRRK